MQRRASFSFALQLLISTALCCCCLALSLASAQRIEQTNAAYDRTVYGCGTNVRGELGMFEHRSPYPVVSLNTSKIISWCATPDAVIALDDASKAHVWGNGAGYQTGLGSTALTRIATQLSTLPQSGTWDSVACAPQHVIVSSSTDRREVYAWAANAYGSLGTLGAPLIEPTNASALLGANQFKAFYSTREGVTSFLVNQTNHLLAMGWNKLGQMGMSNPVAETYSTPTEVTWYSSLLASNGVNAHIDSIVGGSDYTFFLLKNGDLYSSGNNLNGGRGRPQSSTVEFSSLLVANNVAAVASYGRATWVIFKNNDVHAFGDNGNGRAAMPLSTLSVFYAGTSSTLVNTHALGSATASKVSISSSHVLLLASDGSLYGLGSNARGQLGNLPEQLYTNITRIPGVPIAGETVKDILAMPDLTLLLCTSGAVYGIGNPTYAGYGSVFSAPTAIPTMPMKMDQVYAGFEYSFATTPFEGKAYAMGKMVSPSAAPASDDTAPDTTVPAAVAALSHVNVTTVSLLGGGTQNGYGGYALTNDTIYMYGWGSTLNGQMMCGSIHCSPDTIPEPYTQFQKLDINTTRFEVISSGVDHFVSIARNITSPDKLDTIVWGSNEWGQIAYFNYPKAGFPILTVEDMVDTCAGDYHTVLIDINGNVHATGRNREGQSANDLFNDRFSQVTNIEFFNKDPAQKVYCGAYSTFVITKKGQVYVFGDNSYGQLGLDASFNDVNGHVRVPTLNTNLTSIGTILKISSAKSDGGHTLVLTADGLVYGMGRNDNNQLGLATSVTTRQFKPVVLPIPGVSTDIAASKVLDVSAGYTHSLFVVGRKTCPNDCSNDVGRGIVNGVCDATTGTCKCVEKRAGFDCSQISCADPLCSGRGVCDTSFGRCRCFDDYSGGKCEFRKCPNNCSGNGQCDRNRGQCICNSGWSGRDCTSDAVRMLASPFTIVAIVVATLLAMF